VEFSIKAIIRFISRKISGEERVRRNFQSLWREKNTFQEKIIYPSRRHTEMQDRYIFHLINKS
jgi:hypothetical protein